LSRVENGAINNVGCRFGPAKNTGVAPPMIDTASFIFILCLVFFFAIPLLLIDCCFFPTIFSGD